MKLWRWSVWISIAATAIWSVSSSFTLMFLLFCVAGFVYSSAFVDFFCSWCYNWATREALAAKLLLDVVLLVIWSDCSFDFAFSRDFVIWDPSNLVFSSLQTSATEIVKFKSLKWFECIDSVIHHEFAECLADIASLSPPLASQFFDLVIGFC